MKNLHKVRVLIKGNPDWQYVEIPNGSGIRSEFLSRRGAEAEFDYYSKKCTQPLEIGDIYHVQWIYADSIYKDCFKGQLIYNQPIPA